MMVRNTGAVGTVENPALLRARKYVARRLVVDGDRGTYRDFLNFPSRTSITRRFRSTSASVSFKASPMRSPVV